MIKESREKNYNIKSKWKMQKIFHKTAKKKFCGGCGNQNMDDDKKKEKKRMLIKQKDTDMLI